MSRVEKLSHKRSACYRIWLKDPFTWPHFGKFYFHRLIIILISIFHIWLFVKLKFCCIFFRSHVCKNWIEQFEQNIWFRIEPTSFNRSTHCNDMSQCRIHKFLIVHKISKFRGGSRHFTKIVKDSLLKLLMRPWKIYTA